MVLRIVHDATPIGDGEDMIKNQQASQDEKPGHQVFRYIERGGMTHHRDDRKAAENRERHAHGDAAKRWRVTAHLVT
jgi:hypothetical protein